METIILAACAFQAFNKAMHKWAPPPHNDERFSSRYTSMLHAGILCAVSAAFLGGKMSISAWETVQAIPAGYLLHDTFRMMTSTALFDPVAIVHHAIFFSCAVWFAKPHAALVAQGYLSELSVPPLYTCWVMVHTSATPQNRATFRALAAATLGLFFVVRVVNFPYLAYQGFRKIGWATGAGLAVLTVMNWYWFWRLLCKATNNGFGSGSRSCGKGRLLRPTTLAPQALGRSPSPAHPTKQESSGYVEIGLRPAGHSPIRSARPTFGGAKGSSRAAVTFLRTE